MLFFLSCIRKCVGQKFTQSGEGDMSFTYFFTGNAMCANAVMCVKVVTLLNNETMFATLRLVYAGQVPFWYMY